jgi:signal transduction histidine kinase
MLAAAALALAMGARLVLTPWLGDSHPLTLAVPAAALVSVVCGVRWALALALAALLWVTAPVLPPEWPKAQPWAARAPVVALLFVAALAGWPFQREPAAAPGPRPSRRHVAMQRALWVSMALSLLLPLVLLGAFASFARDAALATATQNAQSALRVAREHVARVVQGNEIIARQIHAGVAEAGPPRADGTLPALHSFLARLAQSMPHVNSLWVIGADGYPVASSLVAQVPRINYADREYFVFHREQRDATYVSRLLVTRSTRELFFDVSTRWQAADGRFLGVINVTLKPQYFAELFRELAAATPGLSLTLLRNDGFVLARAPGAFAPGDRADDALAAQMRAGRAVGWLPAAPAAVGMSTELAPVEPYPLYIAASLDSGPLMQRWREQVSALGAFALLASFALLAGMWAAWQRALDAVRALEQITHETEQRRRVEEQLRQAQKIEALGKLTSSVAHDFNNVLGVLQNHIALLTHTQPALVASGTVPAMQRAVKSGEHLTRKLLAFSRRRLPTPERVDLAQALPGLDDLLRMTVGGSTELHVSVVPGTPPIEVDRAELELALLNLATNARGAMAGAGRLVVQALAGGRGCRVAGRDATGGGTERVRQRRRHGRGHPGTGHRTLFHHQARGPGHRPRPEPGRHPVPASRGCDAHRQRTGRGHHGASVLPGHGQRRFGRRTRRRSGRRTARGPRVGGR